MTIVNTVDKRNTEWRDNNIGSKLLGKMGWKEGSGIGLRNKNVTALRAVKRQVGLGIGAKRQSEAGPSESTGTFAAVLANLKSHHGGNSDEDDDDEKKKKKKSKKDKKKKKKNQSKEGGLMLPQNKVLAGHSRKMREAKFGTKSQHDLACIFGNTDVVETAVGSFTPIAAPIQATTTKVLPSVAAVSSKKRSRDNDDEDDDDDDDSPSSSSSDADDADDNEELLVTKKEEKEQKRAAKKQRKEEKKKQKKSSTLDDKKKKSKKSSKKI